MNRLSSRVLSTLVCLFLWKMEAFGLPDFTYCSEKTCKCTEFPAKKNNECFRGAFCFFESDQKYGCLEERKDRDLCRHTEGCVCHKSDNPSTEKKVCPKGTRCILNSDKFDCVEDILEKGEKCKSETCRCGIKNSYADFSQPMVIEGPSCTKDQFCLFEDPKTSKSSGPAQNQNGWLCSKDVIGLSQIAASDSTFCLPTDSSFSIKYVRCTTGSVCFIKDIVGSEPICNERPISPGDKCSAKKSSYCVCLPSGPNAQGAEINQGQICFVDPFNPRVISVEAISPKDFCASLQGCLCFNPIDPSQPPVYIDRYNICLLVNSVIKPAFEIRAERKICKINTGCECGSSDSPKIKCAFLEQCIIKDKKPSCSKTNFIFQRVCEDDLCLCLAREEADGHYVGKDNHYRFCTRGKFCGKKNYNGKDHAFCYDTILSPEKKCTDKDGCICTLSTSEESSLDATDCRKEELCVIDTSFKKPACVSQKIVADSPGPHKMVPGDYFLCVAEDHPKPGQTSTRACPNSEAIICGRVGDELGCGETEIEPKELSSPQICDYSSCICLVRPKKKVDSIDFCLKNAACYTGPEGAATCSNPPIKFGQTCQNPKGCLFREENTDAQNPGQQNVQKMGSKRPAFPENPPKILFCPGGMTGLKVKDELVCQDPDRHNLITDGFFCTNRAVGCWCKKEWNGAEKGVECRPMADCKKSEKGMTCSNESDKVYFCSSEINCPCGLGLGKSDGKDYCKIGFINSWTSKPKNDDTVITEEKIQAERLKQIKLGYWGFEQTPGVKKSRRQLIRSQDTLV